MEKVASYLFLVLLAYIPFHVFLSTWAGTSFGILDSLKALKDIILLIGLLISISVSINKIKDLKHKYILILITIFILLNSAYFFIFNNQLEPEILSLVYGTRFLLFFVYGYLVSQFSTFNKSQFLITVKKIVLSTGAVIAILGIAQVWVLPDTTLNHFGYSKASGTPAAYYISDDKKDERAYSTLKDPNSLGSYMIIIILLAISEINNKKKKVYSNKILGLISAASLLCLLLTYSRSAILGLVVALGTYVYFNELLNPKFKRFISVGAILIFSVAVLTILLFRNTAFIRTTVLHIGDSSNSEITSNSIRSNALKESFTRISDRPFGEGLGTAGPSALKNTEQKVALTENHFLQVAVELGIFGIMTFIAITILVARNLYRNRKNIFCLFLLASFMGLIVTNNLVHIWSNEAVAYTWWGLAGLVVFASFKKNEKYL